jgi:D-lyxose ketol-isomerase
MDNMGLNLPFNEFFDVKDIWSSEEISQEINRDCKLIEWYAEKITGKIKYFYSPICFNVNEKKNIIDIFAKYSDYEITNIIEKHEHDEKSKLFKNIDLTVVKCENCSMLRNTTTRVELKPSDSFCIMTGNIISRKTDFCKFFNNLS